MQYVQLSPGQLRIIADAVTTLHSKTYLVLDEDSFILKGEDELKEEDIVFATIEENHLIIIP